MNSETASPITKLILLLSLHLFSFVVVLDRTGSHRTPGLESDLMPPEYTFRGEIMGTKDTGEAVVRGNAFACVAESLDHVRERMVSSVYFWKVCARSPVLQGANSVLNLYWSRVYGIWKPSGSPRLKLSIQATICRSKS